MLVAMEFWDRESAANDNRFLPQRHRTLPIEQSITPIANYPTKLRIFQTNASMYWQVRCYLRGKTYTQSLKTTNKQAAISQAKHFFHIKTAELYGEHIAVREESVPLFKHIVPATLAQQQARVDRDDLTALSLSIFRSRLYNYILPFFGSMALEKVNYQHLTDFVALLTKKGQSTASIQQNLVDTRKVFNYAHGLNLIRSLPKFPNITILIVDQKKVALVQRADLFRIGKLLRISPSNESLRCEVDEIFKRQNRMRASVSRLLKRTELLIANVEQGIFPNFKPVIPLERERFSTRQLEMHKTLEALWWSLDLTSSLGIGKIDEARRVHYEEEMRVRQSSITEKRERVIKYS